MMFEWDDDKNSRNIEKHGVGFKEAQQIFYGPTVDFIDDRFSYGELREISIGTIAGAVILVVAHTDRKGICRIISARPALKKEKRLYEQKIRQTYDP